MNENIPQMTWQSNRLFMLRTDAGLTQKHVAAQCGMRQGTYCRIENGGDCYLRNAKTIAKFFGRTVDEIWQ